VLSYHMEKVMEKVMVDTTTLQMIYGVVRRRARPRRDTKRVEMSSWLPHQIRICEPFLPKPPDTGLVLSVDKEAQNQ